MNYENCVFQATWFSIGLDPEKNQQGYSYYMTGQECMKNTRSPDNEEPLRNASVGAWIKAFIGLLLLYLLLAYVVL